MTACRRLTSATLGLSLAVGLAACGSLAKPPEPVCPDLRMDRDTASITVFDGTGTDITDVLFEVQVTDVAGDCGFEETDDGPHGVTQAKFNVLFTVTKGPAMTQDTGHFTYFVALPSFYPAPAAKQTLPVDFTFPKGNVASFQVRDEPVEIAIPVDSREAAADIPLYVGFQLTKAQLEYNRQAAAR